MLQEEMADMELERGNVPFKTKTEFRGEASIKVFFKYKAEYEKFRKYILKTDWNIGAGSYPSYEELKMTFSSMDDIAKITATIVLLLQMKFKVYCAQFKLEEELVETEHPTEDDSEEAPDISEFEFGSPDFNNMLKRTWKELGLD